jgi:hypothetical protein
MRRIVTAGLSAVLLTGGTGRLPGQARYPVSIQASALTVVPSGEALANTKAGPGAELQLRVHLASIGEAALSIGAGGQFSSHQVGASNPLLLTGAFVEPRYAFVLGGSFLYLSARFAVLRQSLSSDGVSGSAAGSQMNVGGGILVPVGGGMNLDFGASFGTLRFGDFGVSYSGGTGFNGSAVSGTNLLLRGGIEVALGGS